VGPCSRPLDIEERLQQMGFRAAEHETGMRVALPDLREALPPRGLKVERVSSPHHLEDMSRVLAENWEPPDPAVALFYRVAAPSILGAESALRYLIGYLDGEPAAVAGLYLEGGIGAIHSVATRRALRGRGIGSRLAWAAADEARRAGAACAVLQASSEGRQIHERLGFRACCRFAEYTPSGQ